MENILLSIAEKAPLSSKELIQFINIRYHVFFKRHNISTETLPKEMLLGVIIKFFNENSIEFAIADTDDTSLTDAIIDTFVEYDKVIAHYS